MNHINLDTLPEPMREFIRAMVVAPGGSVIEENGKRLASVTPVWKPSDGAPSEWTEAKNQRRCDLIDREIDGSLTVEERVELEDLQDQMLRYRHRVAPLPLAQAQRLLDELERKAATSGASTRT